MSNKSTLERVKGDEETEIEEIKENEDKSYLKKTKNPRRQKRSEAQKRAFDKARMTRHNNLRRLKDIQEKERDDNKKAIKEEAINQIKNEMYEMEEYEKLKRKPQPKKRKPKKKTVVYISSSESEEESEDEIIVKRKPKIKEKRTYKQNDYKYSCDDGLIIC